MTFGLFCKSFRRDLLRFERLYASVEAHDQDGLPFAVCVPESDRGLFERRFGRKRVQFTTDEALFGGPVAQSWRMQQVVKLQTWKLEFADAFAMLDSDFYFIRDFGARDFLGDDGSLRFVVSREWHKYDAQNSRLLAFLRGESELPRVTREECAGFSRELRASRGPSRARLWLDAVTRPPYYERMKRIRATFGRSGPDLHVMPGPIWTRQILASFRDEFLLERKLSYRDLIWFSPWEYVWIAEWLLARGLPGFTPSEPLFLHFDSDESIRDARAQGFRIEDFRRRYLGLVLASGHSAQRLEEY